MVKEKNSVGLSREYIIHPGETLEEVITDRGMSQRELAIRTGVTEKHVSTVIHGQKNISASFARMLEYALGIEASFWMNLQANYDRELLEYEDMNEITEEEISVLKSLKEVTTLWTSWQWLDSDADSVELVLEYRKIFGISNLLDTPKISYSAAYRVQYKNVNVDPYVLFAWQIMCERLTKNADIAENVDAKKLIDKIPKIKSIMFMETDQIQNELESVFAECGIAFKIVPHFVGAPVQGFIKKTTSGSLILCMTLRQKFADIFWFTLFHEIAHILNGDTKREFLDLNSVSGEIETKANMLACDLLIDPNEYEKFVSTGSYKHQSEIEKFAASQNVKDYIVRGRLMKEEIIPWADRDKYEWAVCDKG